MAAGNYTKLAAHKAEHAELTAKVLAFKKDFDAGRASVSVQLMMFLLQWLQSHILNSDQAYMPYVADVTEA